MTSDVLAWLVPEAGARERERLRRIVTGARLLCDDAATRRGETVGLDLESARAELERLRRSRLLLALETLLHAYLEAGERRDSFLDLGTPPLSWPLAWRTLVRAGNEKALARLPRPGEDPLEVARRLHAASGALGAAQSWRELWGARIAHVFSSEPDEERWRSSLERARGADRPLAERAALLSGLLAARLDRGDPRGARDLFEGKEVEASVDPGTCRLFSWAAVLTGDLDLARELARGLPARARRVPPALLELAALVPAWAPLLAGTPPSVGRAHAPSRLLARGALGAVVFGVFTLSVEGELRVLHLDAAPGVRAGLHARLAERDGAWRRPGEPEQRLLVAASPHGAQRTARAALRGALAPEHARALLLIPIPDADGETAGWLHVETEHHLLPSCERARAIAAGWSAEVVAAHRERAAVELGGTGSSAPADPRAQERAAADERGLEPDDPRRECFETIVAELGLKTARRRLWIVEPVGEGFRVLAEQGGGLEDWRARRGGARALRRSLLTGAAVAFDRPEVPLGLHAAAASGLVLPLAVAGRVHGFVAIESERRGDLGERDRERLGKLALGLAERWRAAQFASWHRRRCGHEIHWDARSLAWETAREAWLAAARSSAPLWIAGPGGSGKEVLARWMHFEGAHPEAPLVRGSARGAADAGTQVLDGTALDEGAGTRGEPALAHLSREEVRARVIVLARALPEELLAQGRLGNELARRFSGRVLRVAPLADRRDEIPGLVRRMSERFAREHGLAPAHFPDETLALFWRQSWPEGTCTLEELVGKLVLLRPGARVEPGDVAKLARPFGLQLRERLPSRRPRRHDLLLALRTTAHRSGAWNKARAARYLGWDPDTLDARLGERAEPKSDAEG